MFNMDSMSTTTKVLAGITVLGAIATGISVIKDHNDNAECCGCCDELADAPCELADPTV